MNDHKIDTTSNDIRDLRWEALADEALIARWRADRDGVEGQQALAQLLGRYRRLVYNHCWRFVRERELALDLTQEILVSAYQGLDGFGERAAFRSWLFSITHNRCLSELRKRQLEREDEAILDLLVEPRPTPDRKLEEEEAVERLRQLIRDHLTGLEQDALWLRCMEEVPVDEITRLLVIEEQSGARAVLQRARRHLRAVLKQRADADLEEGTP